MEKNEKKIAIFTGYFLPFLGGIERYTDKLADQLQSLGYKIIIVTSNYDNFKSEEKGKYHIFRIPIYSLFHKRYPIPKKNKEYKKIMNKLNNENIDAVICNTRFHLTSLIGGKFAKKNKIPVLVIEHGSNHFTVNNKILDIFGAIYEHGLTMHLKKFVHKFYGVSKRCNDWLKHFKINANGVFYNSIDENAYNNFKNKHYLKKNPNKIVITFAGRIIKEKGIIELLEAYKKITKKYDNIELYIAGDGPILEQLKKDYQHKNVHFEGKLTYNEVMSLYNDTDIFVHPSMFPEGLPTVILEAGIMKCAIIATDRGGTIEVINDEKYGIIVGENIDSITEKICYLLDNKDEINKRKENIHKRIMENFTWKVTAKQVSDELEVMINEKSN